MQISRRNLLKNAGAVAVTATTTSCLRASSIQSNPARRRLMINGNLVFPFAEEGMLDPASTELIRSTGLACAKATIGGSSATYAEVTQELDLYDQALRDNTHIYAPIRGVADIDNAFETERIGILKSFEAATMFEGKVDRIAEFAARDVRVMQLGYNNTSLFGAGAMSRSGDLGLTPLGREAIGAMEEAGVMLDLSHAHDITTMDALKAIGKPAAITHGGCSAVHEHPRNKSDKVLKAVAETGGVVGVYELSYLTASLEQTPLSAYMNHLEHAINICGEDHVGIGSDALMLEFDTSEESQRGWAKAIAARKAAGVAAPGEGPMPFVVGLNGPHRMHTIVVELEKRGYRAAAIDKIMGLNFRRVFAEAWGDAA